MKFYHEGGVQDVKRTRDRAKGYTPAPRIWALQLHMEGNSQRLIARALKPANIVDGSIARSKSCCLE